jgi:glycosyltransferase involved in cell wall biosynthesis
LQLRDLNICFVAGTLGQGGAERQLFFMVRTLREAGARVRVLSLTKDEFWHRQIEDCGTEVIHIGARQNRLARAWAVIREIRKERPDILQSQHFYTNLYVWLAAGVTGIPGIGAIRSNVTNEVAANGRLLGRLSLHAPRYLIANSEAAVETTHRRGVSRDRVFLLPNVVDRSDEVRSGVRNRPLHILSIGRLTRQKRHDLLLDALGKLHAQGIPFVCTIAGDGPLRQEIQAEVGRLGLLDCMRFPGAVADTRPLYESADLFVLSSDYEGTPNVVLEAMAHGLAVVATNVGGVPALISNEQTGLLTEPRDSAALADAIERVAANPSLRAKLGSRALAHVREHHSCRTLTRNLEAIYRMVLHSENGQSIQ